MNRKAEEYNSKIEEYMHKVEGYLHKYAKYDTYDASIYEQLSWQNMNIEDCCKAFDRCPLLTVRIGEKAKIKYDATYNENGKYITKYFYAYTPEEVALKAAKFKNINPYEFIDVRVRPYWGKDYKYYHVEPVCTLSVTETEDHELSQRKVTNITYRYVNVHDQSI